MCARPTNGTFGQSLVAAVSGCGSHGRGRTVADKDGELSGCFCCVELICLEGTQRARPNDGTFGESLVAVVT